MILQANEFLESPKMLPCRL